MATVVLLSSTVSTALQSIKDSTAPSPPSQADPQLHDWHCMTPGLVECSSLELPRQDNQCLPFTC